MKTLNQIPFGEYGRVVEVQGVDDISVRLLEMGLTPGVEFQIIGSAPLGDPLELEVRGYRLSIRKDEAIRVVIESI